MTAFEEVIATGEQGREFIAATGGLPEIHRAAADFRTAIDQTRQEIDTAVFAGRFPRQTLDYFKTMVFSGGSGAPTLKTRELIDSEGEAGYKRAVLGAELDSIENEMSILVNRLTELRCDLVVSQSEFDFSNSGQAERE